VQNLVPLIGAPWHVAKRAKAERDRAIAERDRALAERDRALAERDRALAERDAAYEERDRAWRERDSALLEVGAPRVAAADATAALRVRTGVYQEAEPGAKRALVILMRGPAANREIEITQPFFEAYCRRIGIDLQIVEVPQAVPPFLAKARLLPIVEQYDRFAILETHMMIRQGSPDLFAIVPADKVGAMPEGRWTDRRERCIELSGLCGFSTPLQEERYFNTDLLVMSRAHLQMLRALSEEPISNYRLDEQDALNALLYHNDVPVFALPRDFNWIPYSPVEFDWRWSWIFNLSNSWRAPPTQKHAWRQVSDGAGGHYSRTQLAPGQCRLPLLIETAEQLRGSVVRFVSAAEMNYRGLSARIHLTPDELAVMWCGVSSLSEGPAIYGPYLDLAAGWWSVTLLEPDGLTPVAPDIVVDVVHDFGRNTARSRAPIGPGATFSFELDRDVTKTEVRMYSGDRDYTVGWIVFRATERPIEESSQGREQDKILLGIKHKLVPTKPEFHARRVRC
jgi:hypothetical protein